MYKVKYILDNLNTDILVNMDLTELNFELGDADEQFKTMENVKYVLEENNVKYMLEESNDKSVFKGKRLQKAYLKCVKLFFRVWGRG